MKLKTILAVLLTTAILGVLLAPTAANAQDWLRQAQHHRQQTKNTWRNVAIGAGAVGLYGLLKHDNTLTFAGGAGALYSLWRYDQDRKSQNSLNRARAEYFSRSSFYRNGHRYHRRTVWRNGQEYYQFVRG